MEADGIDVFERVAGDEGEHLALVPELLLGVLGVADVVDLRVHVTPVKDENE